jgi:hypothetical protein
MKLICWLIGHTKGEMSNPKGGYQGGVSNDSADWDPVKKRYKRGIQTTFCQRCYTKLQEMKEYE